MNQISFEVPGQPQTEGNMKAFNGHIVHADGPGLRAYRKAVGIVAKSKGCRPGPGPISLDVQFVCKRPNDHFVANDPLRDLKPTAPAYVTKRPDIDKLLRAVLDALTGIAYDDDNQVVHVNMRQTYGTPKLMVTVRQIAADVPEEAVRITK